MTLIKSISGIRGNIGGVENENLTPIDIVKFTSAYVELIRRKTGVKRVKIVVGRDARPSGEMVESVVIGTLVACGADVINLGLATTPTVEMGVVWHSASGGVIITASHNPKNWNALKLLNSRGEFLDAKDGIELLKIADRGDVEYAEVDDLGRTTTDQLDQKHIEAVLALPLVNRAAVAKMRYRVVVDGINSVGGVVIPQLLRQMGVEVVELHCEPTGEFAHNPEPLAENLTEISAKVVEIGADLGIVVDPDVDRLALINEDGTMFGEEYTLVAVADYVLSRVGGNTVSNLSSSRALRDITEQHGGRYEVSAVGEVNVVEKMKQIGAVIGGEGNGGVIYPELHYGRDALVGVALFMTHLAKSGEKMTELKRRYPKYHISKNKIELTPETDVDAILERVKKLYSDNEINDTDGIRIDFTERREWVHLRKSNTEPIIRVYSESEDEASAEALAESVMEVIRKM